MIGRATFYTVIFLLVFTVAGGGCAPVEYSVVIVGANEAIAEAEAAGASCTEQQLAELSPVTRYDALQSGVELATTEIANSDASDGPRCSAPFEYYSALEFLSKAREEVGYSDYQAALEYAREARANAQKAKAMSIYSGMETAQ